ncbi:MarR family transcriptional regulator, partial [Clavibacter michiganensis subsp. michiganensis]|nr:MarR family transcriptional regulator [Clavibacter michiganensis subsp. michiganensis]
EFGDAASPASPADTAAPAAAPGRAR